MADLWVPALVCVLILALLAGWIVLARRTRRQWDHLRVRGKLATARVILVWTDDATGRSMTYRFRAEAQGRSVLASASIYGLYAQEPKPGDEVPVLYDPEQPEISRLLPRKPA